MSNIKILSNAEIERYSRQLIIPDYGIESQIKLKSSSVLIIGCGGLGCPSALYLSTAGIGRLGLVDNDFVEISNIHRQIAHEIHHVGVNKAKNLAHKCQSLNDQIKYDYDVILDCTDNVITRYLINDVCVLLNKPLVSGSALKFEGQLTVYNYLNGPCYRCLYPKAPPAHSVSNCSDAGILGPIVGTIGSLQALEAIKIIAGIGKSLSGRMMIFDGLDFQTRIIKLRPRQIETCIMCQSATDTKLSQTDKNQILDKFDYSQFCGVSNYNDKSQNVTVLSDEKRVNCSEYKNVSEPHLLIDVRPKCQFNICSLPQSLNVPFDQLVYDEENVVKSIRENLGENKSIFVVCRRGNDSQLAVEILEKHLSPNIVKDIKGGLQSWSKEIDPNFPKY
ncbi:adenylyltransferase and sulfurtransferase MOCS3-like [Brachionus plicatilis]|uniref:Adenylyltransferase and sulfurtransferase MOCS3 homolog n=1 Tax=Brachionus plicatilis TaxID=10195 RepID=A0A3M7PTU3_BRAPC|nr:adenylyltransferase and sulfurtransferase MOCS3-like [Brachionus plicatilis]